MSAQTKTFLVVTILAASFCFLLSAPSAHAESRQVRLVWDAPTLNMDGTPLTDLGGYFLKISASPNNYSTLKEILVPANQVSYTASDLTLGSTYYFVVTAFDTSGNESPASNEISVHVGDSDNDLVVDVQDNCPNVSNPLQEDSNYNSIGDACDTADSDQDGAIDMLDNCPAVKNTDQADINENGIGDVCDTADSDEDTTLDANDNCPAITNPDQLDSNGNGIGNACESAAKVPFDYNGDLKSDIGVFSKQSYRIYTSLNTNSASAVLSGKLKAKYVGAGDTDGNGKDLIIAVNVKKTKKSGNILSWSAVNPVSGKSKEFAQFGASSETPVIGCYAKGKLLPAVLKKGSSVTQLRLYDKKKPKVLKLSKEVSQVSCVVGDKRESKLLILSTSKKSGSKITAANLRGKKLYDVKLNGPATTMFLIPQFGYSKERVGYIEKSAQGFTAKLYSAETSSFETIASFGPSSNMRSVTGGVSTGEYSWLAVLTNSGINVTRIGVAASTLNNNSLDVASNESIIGGRTIKAK